VQALHEPSPRTMQGLMGGGGGTHATQQGQAHQRRCLRTVVPVEGEFEGPVDAPVRTPGAGGDADADCLRDRAGGTTTSLPASTFRGAGKAMGKGHMDMGLTPRAKTCSR
jgi:hypothetical protein